MVALSLFYMEHVTGSEHVLVNGAVGIMDQIDLARRIAFALSKAAAVTLDAHTNAQMLESNAPVASREALIEQRVPENEPPN